MKTKFLRIQFAGAFQYSVIKSFGHFGTIASKSFANSCNISNIFGEESFKTNGFRIQNIDRITRRDLGAGFFKKIGDKIIQTRFFGIGLSQIL